MNPKLAVNLRTSIEQLIQQFQWKLTDAETLYEDVVRDKSEEELQTGLNNIVKWRYAAIIFAACKSKEDTDRQNQAYAELRQYLLRDAQRRYPDIAIDAAQRALQLIYEQIERCQSPETFLTFVRFKLLQATKEILQDKPPSPDPDNDNPTHGEAIIPDPTIERLCKEEGIEELRSAIHQLPDERQRQTIILKYFESLRDSEIAQRLNTTENHVRVLRNRAMVGLRGNKSLRRYFLDEPYDL